MTNHQAVDPRVKEAASIIVATQAHAASFTQSPNMDATSRAMGALAVWEALTGLEGDRAIAMARRLAFGANASS